ncbi:hypothetical protein E3C22_03025 [Jiella endophytica]|uniref:Uncharacterized protein n=1 Tax=Jiella endophytica TaxID=2558362 RepID=A0A4Y8RUG0_9HYPH|nr:hypothetical protein [Jiella endophytica]TFF27447.1 hypothetical protein E3C22_03025 [Jiella endophytica]
MRQAIADQFGIERGSFVLNFPPRPGCLPASIFTDDLKIPLKRTARDDPALDRGPAFDFSADLSFDAGAEAQTNVASFFGVKADASNASDAKLEFRNARAVEMLGAEMKKRVLADPDAKAAAERRVSPFMVSRAFEGKVSLRLTRKAGMSADAWANIKAQPVEVRAGVHVSAGDEVVITVDDPVVFAFEVVRTNYVTTHLGPGKGPDDVRFVPIPEDLFER